jgi:hypothetical protein
MSGRDLHVVEITPRCKEWAAFRALRRFDLMVVAEVLIYVGRL